MLDGCESTNTDHAKDEQALRALLSRVMDAPLLPITTSLKALEDVPKEIEKIQKSLRAVGVTATNLSDQSVKLINEIGEAREDLEKIAREIAAKADGLIASTAAGGQVLDDIAVRLETLAAGHATGAASLARMEAALFSTLDSHVGRITAEMARQMTMLKWINLACLAGIIALSLIVFLKHFVH